MSRIVLGMFLFGFVAACSDQEIKGEEDVGSDVDEGGDEGGDEGDDEGRGDLGLGGGLVTGDSDGDVGDKPADDSGSVDDGTGGDTDLPDDGTVECDPALADCDTECMCSDHRSPFEDDCGPEDCVDTCTGGGGYWMNSPEEWPVGIEGMYLGDACYTKDQIIEFIGLSTSVGDASIQLGTNLIAARLNIASGIPSTDEVDAAIIAADAWIVANVTSDATVDAMGLSGTLPYGIHGSTEAGAAAKLIDDVLAAYNGGLIPEICEEEPAEVTSEPFSCPVPEEEAPVEEDPIVTDTGSAPL